jgi:hypothetical protein
LLAHFAELRDIKYKFKIRIQIWDMEGKEGAFSHEKEAKGKNICVGNAETKSNGHRSRGEQETLIKIVRILRIEVQSYKENNEMIQVDIGGHPPIPLARKTVFHLGSFFLVFGSRTSGAVLRL